jgi:hypothetical protein
MGKTSFFQYISKYYKYDYQLMKIDFIDFTDNKHFNYAPPLNYVKSYIEQKILNQQLIKNRISKSIICFDNIEKLCKNTDLIDF